MESRKSSVFYRDGEYLEETTSLEDYCADWERHPPPFSQKRALVEKVALISRLMHGGGVCHRDFYICHFLLDRTVDKSESTGWPRLFLIDLHRALCKRRLGRRWIEKDVAGLYFSSREIGLTRRDLLRFVRVYADAGLRDTLQRQGQFWNRVVSKGEALYRRLGNPGRVNP